MANKLQAHWIAVHVDTPNVQLSEEQTKSVMQNMRLAEKLGAETRILSGLDVVREIMDFAHEQNITIIMVWKHLRPRWRDFLVGSLADDLLRRSGEIDVYVVTSEKYESKPTEPPSLGPSTPKRRTPWSIYGLSLFMVGLATLVDFLIFPHSGASNLIMAYLLAVTFVALFGEIGPSFVASILSVLSYDFFFMPPYYSFFIKNYANLFTLLVMLLVTQVISHTSVRTRRQVETARLGEHYTSILHSLSKQLASTRGTDKLLGTAIRYLGEVFDSDMIVLMPENNHLSIRAAYGTEAVLSTKEMGVAQWVLDLGQNAGLGTDTLPFSDALYVPLLASQGVVGVLRVHPMQAKKIFTSDQMHLLEACANQIGLALEVDHLHEQARKSELQSETKRARSTLLQSVSHDLRTPLVAVMGAASTLMEIGPSLQPETIQKLAREIYVELDQLNRLINNLLQMTYLEAEAVQLQIQPHSLRDVINTAVSSLSQKLLKKPLNITLPVNLPDISFDNTLIQEVVYNLIDNAIKFTPPETPIDISVAIMKEFAVVSVEDKGPGIVLDEVDRLFEKFYRGRKLTTERGLGLGLAICNNIIKAHGGEIWAENRTDCGAAFRFTLPLYPHLAGFKQG